jgi:hypothetical protein
MKQKIKIILILIITANVIQANAQQQRILAMSTTATPPAGDSTAFGVPIIDSNTLFTTAMSVILDITDSIFQLHVKLGSTLHGSEFLSASFDYGSNGTFGNTSYSQSGNAILLGLGDHAGMVNYYAEVQIEKTDHTFEDAVLFSKH